MQASYFFNHIRDHYQSRRPFVIYRKPNTTAIKAVLQQDDYLHYVNNFTESGFVFAPFNLAEKAVILPFSSSALLTLSTYDDKDIVDFSVKTNETFTQREAYIEMVKKALNALQNTEGFKKVVLSRKEVISIKQPDIFDIYKNILQRYPSAFCYLWYHPKVGLWIGATPETLLQLTRNKLQTMALAGTQKYTNTLEVTWGEKEKEEQQMVTDTMVNALSDVIKELQVSQPNTHKAGSLLHLRTDIMGFLPTTTSVKTILLALHPTPAVCGLPKKQAQDFIGNNESYKRTFYSGFLGELNKTEFLERNSNKRNIENSAYKATTKTSHLFVNLRSMEVLNNAIHLFIGAGITANSDAEAEWEETQHKANIMKQVLNSKALF